MADDDDVSSNADSTPMESDKDWSEENNDNNSDAMNLGEDSIASDDEIDPAVAVEVIKGLKGAMSGKRGRAGRYNARKRATKAEVKGKGKSHAAANESAKEKAGSRCNNKFFGEIIGRLDEPKREIIRARGFGHLLEFDGCHVPRGFYQWIADHVDVNCFDILVGGKVIPCSPHALHLFLGLPKGGKDIQKHHDDSVKDNFLKKINVKGKLLPLKSTFAEQLTSDSVLSDDDFFRYFMVAALSYFLCPNSSTIPSPKYLGPLLDVSTAKDWDWSKFVFDWLFNAIANYKRSRRTQTVGGCIYFLPGYYLDFLDFGFVREIPITIPRIKVWRGSMIKDYAKYDSISEDKYGKRPVIGYHQTCYVKDCTGFRDTLKDQCGYLDEGDIDTLCEMYEEHHTNFGYRYPDALFCNMFNELKRSSFARRRAEAAAAAAPPSASAAAPSASAAAADADVDASPPEHDAPAYSPAHAASVDEDVGMVDVPSETAMKEADHAAGPSGEGVQEGGAADKEVADLVPGASGKGLEEVGAAADCASQKAVEVEGSAAVDCPVEKSAEGQVAAAASLSEKAVEMEGAGATACQSEKVVQVEGAAGASLSEKYVPVEGAAGTACPSQKDVEEEPGAAAKTEEVLTSATEILESDGMYDSPGTEFCGASQGTEILPSSCSSAHESGARNGKRKEGVSSQGSEFLSGSDSQFQASARKSKKRKSNTSPSVSPASGAHVSDRKMRLRTSTRLTGSRNSSGPGATLEDPLIVEEAGAQSSKHARKGRSKGNASSPSIEEVISNGSPVAQTVSGRKRM